MKDYMALWLEGLPKLRSSSLDSPISATGVCDIHLGPSWAFAKITITLEPAEAFEVINDIPEDNEFRENGYLDWAIFGVLDVLMLGQPNTFSNVRITLTGAEYSQVDSSQKAFRWAGRDAARKALESIGEIRGMKRREDPRYRHYWVRLSK